MDIADISIIYHIGLVLGVLWIFVSFGWRHNAIFFFAFLYLYKVSERYSMRLRRRLQYEERKNANQRRVLSDTESVRWLNYAVQKMWPICMEQIVSQLLLPIIPWFLDKFKPWTVSKATMQKLYMGRNPPMFTDMRVLGESSDGDHLVLELGMNFLSAEDMSAVLQAQLRKSVGFGITANMHITSMHVEGKVLVGVKFIRKWPFLGRVRICFVEPPYFQMTVKPLFSHGIDVTELPGISGWLDNLLDAAFGQTLVEPNMLVIDVEKFVSAPTEEWFKIDEKPPIAHVLLEILEGADMKPSDLNGLADPYIKGQLGQYKFKTKIQRKTLSPKWTEEFKIPITSWDSANELFLQVYDKDPMFDDTMGDCSVCINELKDGQRHEKWLSLKNIKMGRIRLAITVLEEESAKGTRDLILDTEEKFEKSETISPIPTPIDEKNTNNKPFNKNENIVDELEPIDIEGQDKTGIWVHRPGSSISPTFETRKGRVRQPETQVSKNDENTPSLSRAPSQVQKTPRKVSSFKERELPTLGTKRTGVKMVLDEDSVSGEKELREEKERIESLGKNESSKPKGLMSMFSRKGSKKAKDELIESDDNDGSIGGFPVVEGSPINSTLDQEKELNVVHDS